METLIYILKKLRFARIHYQNIYFTKLEKLKEMNRFPSVNDPTKLNKDEVNTLIRHKETNEEKTVLKYLTIKKKTQLGGFNLEIYHTFKIELTLKLQKLFSKIGRNSSQIQFMNSVSL